MPAIILDSNQLALMTCRAGIGRAGVCRAGCLIDSRNLTAAGLNAWTRTRALNPAHNSPPASSSWTTVKEAS